MSGAGRGTPRVSPNTQLPTPPGTDPVPSNLVPLVEGKYFQNFVGGDPATLLTANYQQLQGGVDPYQGMTRLSLLFRYVSGGAGGAFQVRIKQIVGFPYTQFYYAAPASGTPSTDENVVKLLRPVFTHEPVAAGQTLGISFEMHIPVIGFNSFVFEAKEVGNIVSPGTLLFAGGVADNLLGTLVPTVASVD